MTVDPEDRVVRRYAVEICARALGADPREELPDFPCPPSEVRAEDLLLVGVDDLGGVKVLTTPTEQEVAVACSTQVPNPLRLTSRSNQVSGTTDAEQVDGRATWDAGLATAHLEDPRAPHADTDPGRGSDDAVEDIAREPAWSSIVRVRTHAGHATPLRRVPAHVSRRSDGRKNRFYRLPRAAADMSTPANG